MTISRRDTFKLLALGASLGTGAIPLIARADDDDSYDDGDGFRSNKVFTSTNAAGGNELWIYAGTPRKGATDLAALLRLPTGGQGSGAGLGSQGAVTLSGDGRFLFVVNAGNHTVSTFRLRNPEPQLVSVVDSGGLGPISVTEANGFVYVLNAQGAGNVAGFYNNGGQLQALADNVRPLSASGGTAAAQVGINRDGDVLVVTERATNRVTTYRVQRNGALSQPTANASAGQTPFGFAFDRRDNLLVTEAFGGAAGASAMSSYRFDTAVPGQPRLISASVGTTQSAACWVATTPNGRYAYTTNTASGTISAYLVSPNGKLSLLAGIAANTGKGSGPVDADVSNDGRRLHVLSGGALTITSLSVQRDGSLASLGTTTGLIKGTTGLAAN